MCTKPPPGTVFKRGWLQIAQRRLGDTRTGEGRELAKARGVILSRKPKLTGHQRREAIAWREAGEVLTDIARSLHISAVERAGLSSLNEGTKVSYEETENRGKTSAENLRVG
jgi:hypothetical protein